MSVLPLLARSPHCFFILMTCLFLWVAVYTRAPLLVGAQTRAFDILELKLQVVYRCEPPEAGAGNENSGPLQERYACLTAEPSHRTQNLFQTNSLGM